MAAAENMEQTAKNAKLTVNETVHMSAGDKFQVGGFNEMNVGSVSGKVVVKSKTNMKVDAGTKMDIESKSGMKIVDSSGIDLNP
jgi:hypothetical protein